jgi:hypothetical protein
MKRFFAIWALFFAGLTCEVQAQSVGGGGLRAAVAAPGPGQISGQITGQISGQAQQDVIRLIRPPAHRPRLPRTRWQHKAGHALWTRAALSALKDHGKPLVDLVPADIADWCPKYPQAKPAERRAFWVGFMSALAKYESTYKAEAVGGGGKWYGLLQILPATARGYKCRVGTGEALKDGGANLSCAARIMAVTVPRDGVIYGRGGRGVAADLGPMRSAAKRQEMSAWLKQQSYCAVLDGLRPRARP